MRRERGAGGEVTLAGAAEDRTGTRIVTEHDVERKQPNVGRCINCGHHIRVTVSSTCGTCRAWHRWYSAHRLATRYLREATR